MISVRPSDAGRWVNCSAAPRLESPFPDPEGDDAKEGTAAHWLGAQVLGGHYSLDELTDRAAPNGVILTGEMVDHVEIYIDVVRSAIPFPVIERTLPGVPGVQPGTPDAYGICERWGGVYQKQAFLFDFKYGYGIVEAVDNYQLANYAIAIFAKHDWQLDEVIATIVQPRPFHPDGRVRSWTITRDDAISLYHFLTERAAATQAPDALATTGPHCSDCRALHVCEAARRASLNAIDVATNLAPIATTGEELSSELKTLRRALDAIKLRYDAIETDATNRIKSGLIVPGFTVERSYGRRRWTNVDDVPALEALAGVTLTKSTPISPAQAEKAGVDKALVKCFTTTPETGLKLVARDASAKAREVFK